jgi:hypothetical protein
MLPYWWAPFSKVRPYLYWAGSRLTGGIWRYHGRSSQHSFDNCLFLVLKMLRYDNKKQMIVAAIFIPLTFIAGIYGTNFEYLPELKFKYSYFFFWGVMLAVAGVMLIFFRKKKWL